MSKEFLKRACSENRVDRVRQLTQILCILSFSDVTPRELDALCEFLYHGGVCDKAKKSFMMNHKISSANYGQIVKRLADKGILTSKQFRSGKELHTEFQLLKDYFLDQEQAIFVIKTP